MTTQMKKDCAAKSIKVMDATGKGVARVRVAITSVGVQVEGRLAYQYIPQAFIRQRSLSRCRGQSVPRSKRKRPTA
jgi:hypothetical protein